MEPQQPVIGARYPAVADLHEFLANAPRFGRSVTPKSDIFRGWVDQRPGRGVGGDDPGLEAPAKEVNVDAAVIRKAVEDAKGALGKMTLDDAVLRFGAADSVTTGDNVVVATWNESHRELRLVFSKEDHVLIDWSYRKR